MGHQEQINVRVHSAAAWTGKSDTDQAFTKKKEPPTEPHYVLVLESDDCVISAMMNRNVASQVVDSLSRLIRG